MPCNRAKNLKIFLHCFFTACPIGFYGYGCSLSCGNCAFGGPCNVVDGICPSGCDDGWTGDTCHECTCSEILILNIQNPVFVYSFSPIYFDSCQVLRS